MVLIERIELPVYLSAYFPKIRMFIKTPSGILEKCTTSPSTFGETYSDSYGVGVGMKSLKDYKKDFKDPEVLEGVSFMGKVSLPRYLVEEAFFYEELRQKGKFAVAERDRTVEIIFSMVDQHLPSGAPKNDA